MNTLQDPNADTRIPKMDAIDAIRNLMGYTQNATERSVTLYQDDATNTFHAKVGKTEYWARTWTELCAKLVEASNNEE